MIEAYVGAGGKTSSIMARARACKAQGLRVLVTTSTHMERTAEAIVGDNPAAIIRALRETGFALAGQEAQEGKIGPLSHETYLAACAQADIVLVEADGSRRLPLKWPAAHEPVIPDNAQSIVVVMGLSALGKPASQVCHRLELVKAHLGIEADTRMTPEHVQTLLTCGYVQPLRRRYPDKKVTILPRQCDTLYQRALGALLAQEADISLIRPEWFEPQPHLVICGAGHVAKAVADMAAILDFTVTVMDDRAEFACRERFPRAERIISDGFEGLSGLLGREAYCVVVTRGHAQDEACVRAALDSKCAYLGMMGSKKKVRALMQKLSLEGIAQEKLETVHAPIGLNIGAATPAEIAVSILAEIVAHKNQRAVATAPRELLLSRKAGVLCIITQKSGSTPRSVGSMMLVTPEGTLGSVGGGSMEHQVVLDARRARGVEEHDYDLEEGASVGMVCGGKNRVLMIPMQGEEEPRLWHS